MNLDKLIGEYKGNARFYLEGSILSENGFNVGDRYNIYYGKNTVSLAKTADGKKKISKKVKSGILIPVIDLCDGKKSQNIRTILGGKNTAITIEGLNTINCELTYETLLIKKG